MTRLRVVTWLVAAAMSVLSAAAAMASSRIEKIQNQRISGSVYARLSGVTYAQCEARCLDDPQCVALEHFRGEGRIIGRTSSCRLFTSVGEARANTSADVGYKRTEAAASPQPKDQPKERSAKKSARAGEAEERERTAPKAASAPRPEPQPKSLEQAPAPAARKQSPTVGAAPPPPPVVAAPSPAPPPVASAPRVRSIAPGGSAGAPPATDWDVVPVFYGTDRNRTERNKRIAYGSDRARRLELGQALVTVPKSHQIPTIERPWAIKVPYIDWTLYQETEDPKRHFTIQAINVLPKEQALALIRQRLAGSNTFKDQALVFIHGYNNQFDDALFRTAQISYDLKFDGPAFLYSWPSGSGITGYSYDRESSAQAEQYLNRFLTMVLTETGAKNVNIIAHSMGNQPLLQVLRDLKRTNPAISSTINQIILAAPDVDRDTFEYVASQIKDVGRGITMYASSNDVALGVSRRYAGGVPRAGDVAADGPTIVAGIDTIDISSLSSDYLALNHSTYASKTALLQDIEMIIKTGTRPPERRMSAMQPVTGTRGAYWRYEAR